MATQWVHDPQRDGAGCGFCGAWAQVDEDNLCRECFEPEDREDRAEGPEYVERDPEEVRAEYAAEFLGQHFTFQVVGAFTYEG